MTVFVQHADGIAPADFHQRPRNQQHKFHFRRGRSLVAASMILAVLDAKLASRIGWKIPAVLNASSAFGGNFIIFRKMRINQHYLYLLCKMIIICRASTIVMDLRGLPWYRAMPTEALLEGDNRCCEQLGRHF
jgi:hypothetical protein